MLRAMRWLQSWFGLVRSSDSVTNVVHGIISHVCVEIELILIPDGIGLQEARLRRNRQAEQRDDAEDIAPVGDHDFSLPTKGEEK
jgi:hypothetical protein